MKIIYELEKMIRILHGWYGILKKCPVCSIGLKNGERYCPNCDTMLRWE